MYEMCIELGALAFRDTALEGSDVVCYLNIHKCNQKAATRYWTESMLKECIRMLGNRWQLY